MIRLFSFGIFVLTLFFSCNKIENRSDKIMPFMNMNGKEFSGVWNVKEVKLGGVSIDSNPIFIFDECDIYTDTCFAVWSLEGFEALFYWQFQEKGKKFLLNRFPKDSFDSSLVNKADVQCYDYSGLYIVKKFNKKKMSLESEMTKSYSGTLVEIVLEREM